MPPYGVDKRGDQYCVVKEKGDGKKETVKGGCHPTMAKARGHMTALNINVHHPEKARKK